jgi:hypothetical protein
LRISWGAYSIIILMIIVDYMVSLLRGKNDFKIMFLEFYCGYLIFLLITRNFIGFRIFDKFEDQILLFF